MVMGFLKRRVQPPSPPPPPRPTAEWLAGNTFTLGGLSVPLRIAEYDTVYSGGKGTGKTTALKAQMTSHIDAHIASGRPFSALVYTPKPDDFYPLLKARYEPLGVSVRATNPFIADAWSWDGAGDMTNLPKMDQLASVAIKEDLRDQNPFFRKTAQLLYRGVVQSLAATHPGLWTMRHVVLILKDMALCSRVLGRCEKTESLLSLLSSDLGETAGNIHVTLLAELKAAELVASLIDSTPDDRRFSVEDAANEPDVIWVWGSDPRYNTTIEPWNSVQLELIGHELLIRGDVGVTTLLYIDEFPQLSAGGGQKLAIIQKLLEYGRSSLVRSTLAMQTPAQVVEVYGEHAAQTLLGQLHNAVVFRHADAYGQEFWAKRLGRERGFEEKRGASRQIGWAQGSGRNESTTRSVNIERFDLDRISPGEIGDLPVGSYEFGIHGLASLPFSLRPDPKTGIPEPLRWRFHLTPEWIARNVPEAGGYTPYRRSLKAEDVYTLIPFQGWELRFLGLA
jgi:hypothetical protein